MAHTIITTALDRLLDAIVDTVSAAGDAGCDLQVIHAAMSHFGGSRTTHEILISGLVVTGRLRRDKDRLYATTH